MDWIRDKLVPDARNWWKWASTWVMFIITVLPAFIGSLDPQILISFGSHLHPLVLIVVFLVWLAARLWNGHLSKGPQDD